MERLAALPDDEVVGALCSLRCVDVRLAVRVLIGSACGVQTSCGSMTRLCGVA